MANIEAGDTVRFTGKSFRWVVASVTGDTLEIYTFSGNARRGGESYYTRSVSLARVELVRKGNEADDALRTFDANGGSFIAP